LPNTPETATVVLVEVDVDVVEVLLVLLDVELLVEVETARQAPHTLPHPNTVPPAAVQRASSRVTRARIVARVGMQHTTAEGRPQVERAAQLTMPRIASVWQRPLRSALRKRTTQRTCCPCVSAASHGHAAASAAFTSAGHWIGSGPPRRASAPDGSASRRTKASRFRDARIVDLPGGSTCEAEFASGVPGPPALRRRGVEREAVDAATLGRRPSGATANAQADGRHPAPAQTFRRESLARAFGRILPGSGLVRAYHASALS
jgi:hypothetical protein